MILKILMLAAESAPLVKVGGLGDVVGVLPRVLRGMGHDVRVCLPHDRVADAHAERFAFRRRGRVLVPWARGGVMAHEPAGVTEATVDGVPHYLLGGKYVPGDHRVYGASIDEDAPKFIFYSMAALALCEKMDWRPDVVHVHDSHPGAAIYWLATRGRRNLFWKRAATVLTIHNLPFQNNHAAKYLAMAGLRPSRHPLLPWWARDGLMGLAIAYADRLNAVSPGYASEIMGEEHGAGLQDLLQGRADVVRGILNGLDYDQWNPAADRALPVPFDANTLDRRAENKAALQRECGLEVNDGAPLIGVVSRLDHQKGLDIAAGALWEVLEAGAAQVVLLGTGLPEIHAQFQSLAIKYADHASINLRFDPGLASRIYGGCDLFLMPSRYEPCGTSQMIAMRYGAVPVVRATGGLRDTVANYRHGRGTGFVFEPYQSKALLRTVKRALAVYNDRAAWRALQRQCMAARYTWDGSARHYVEMYEQALADKKTKRP